MYTPLWFFALMPLLYLSSCGPSDLERVDEGPASPNILLVMTDDQGYGDLSLHDNDSLHTPVLDQLALEGIQFERFYVSPVCAPTRASLLTGRYHLRTGTSWVTHRKEVMRTSEVTLAEYLKEAGYRTGIFGKWHNGSQYPNDPIGQGFDEFLGFCAGHWNNYFDTRLQRGQEMVPTKGYITDVLTDAALDFIRRDDGRPFFCYVPYNAPHSPFQVPDPYYRFQLSQGLTPRNAAIYGMVENIDANMGRLLAALEEEGIAEETIVVFLSDNGPNGNRFNGGMRGWKGQVHEGGVRVPCFVRWRGNLPAGRKVSELAAHIDLLPTLMELAGLPLDTVNAIDGRSLAPLMRDTAPSWPERAIFNVHTEGEPRLFPGAMRTPTYRLVIDRNNTTQLYHMLEDPGQEVDIAEGQRRVADSLRQLYEAWFLDVSARGFDPLPIPVGYEQAPRVELPAPEAELYGGLAFAGRMGWANDYIIDWGADSDRAVWSLYVAEAGTYAVEADITCTEQAEGLVLVAGAGGSDVERPIDTAFDPQPLPSPDRVPRGEVYEKPWKTFLLGQLSLRGGQQRIYLRPKGDVPPGSLQLKALRLIAQPPQ